MVGDVGVFVWSWFELLMFLLDDEKLVYLDSIVAIRALGLDAVIAECSVFSLDTVAKVVELFASGSAVARTVTLWYIVCFLFSFPVQFRIAVDVVLFPNVRVPYAPTLVSLGHGRSHVISASDRDRKRVV